MTRRPAITASLPHVFGYSRIEASAAIGVSATTFDGLVNDGRMPQPRLIGARKIWDVDEIRAAFKCLPREGDAGDTSWADVG
jgi:predicted DNA-binding transcriptional regulator AlpA